jgi:hypothetical protein
MLSMPTYDLDDHHDRPPRPTTTTEPSLSIAIRRGQSPEGSGGSGDGVVQDIPIVSVGPQVGRQLGRQDDGRLKGVRQFIDHVPQLLRIKGRHCTPTAVDSTVPAFRI